MSEAYDQYLSRPTWFEQTHGRLEGLRVAYVSMEFGVAESVPLYSGGLGVLAGDQLKAASDLGVPLVGVGMLYRQGYFRQSIDSFRRAAGAVSRKRRGGPARGRACGRPTDSR